MGIDFGFARERAIVCVTLMDDGLAARLAREVEPGQLADAGLRVVYEAALAVLGRSGTTDSALVVEELRTRGQLAAAGGVETVEALGVGGWPEVDLLLRELGEVVGDGPTGLDRQGLDPEFRDAARRMFDRRRRLLRRLADHDRDGL